MSDLCLSRRSLLLAAAASAAGLSAGLSGCEAGPGPPHAAQATIEELTPVLLGQLKLLALYEQTLSSFPELTTTLSDLQAQSAAHTDALLDAAPGAAGQIAETSGSRPSASTATLSAAPPQPSPTTAVDAATALANVAQAVSSAVDVLQAAALRAVGDLAALLGSCAASTACHARLLS
ncbi:MAG: hypothetical protein H0T54_08500 [Geodermatophilaceae bacterium]|nr:hypothetical protein [Geodermatophilaceae bacterium]